MGRSLKPLPPVNSAVRSRQRYYSVEGAIMGNNLDHLLKILNFYRWEVQHEFNLLNHRISWYILSQSFLITAFSVSVGYKVNDGNWLIQWVLPILGISTSLLVVPGINGACDTIDMWVRKQRKFLFENNKDGQLNELIISRDENIALSEDKIHISSYYFTRFLPWILIGTWLVIWFLTITHPITIK